MLYGVNFGGQSHRRIQQYWGIPDFLRADGKLQNRHPGNRKVRGALAGIALTLDAAKRGFATARNGRRSVWVVHWTPKGKYSGVYAIYTGEGQVVNTTGTKLLYRDEPI